MKHFFAIIITTSFFVTCSSVTSAQGNYWQQKVDYKIEVKLNDTLHTLDAFITIDYQNNSPNTLDTIYFHLWPNAYRDQSTPLSQQMLENGKTSFWYSKEEQRGYISKIDFKVNAEVCKWDYVTPDHEICAVVLNTPLKTGQTVRISTPFHVKLPETFSRMGHIGQSYQITQWYPKPAVYDKYGWHTFPYLDQGEFYSEFGSFDVSITLPKNYVVGATGDLQDTSEINFMNDLAAQAADKSAWTDGGDMKFPPSSKEFKTLHYKQKNIHDFGWFADKRYHVLKGEVELPHSHNKVTTWALFTNNQPSLWSRAPEYLHDAIQYYSLWIGEYPYKQVTAVDGTISAGSGMEYPNVTVIGEEKNAFSLDDVITHEVGHNWFYGMLGTNERDHAWMDEGINTYYENRYIETKYPNQKLVGKMNPGLAEFLDVIQYKHKYEFDFGYQLMARENEDQPIELTSSKFTDLNYDISVYGKTTLILEYLENYLGKEEFDSIMQQYFRTWQYKHPQPEDFRKIFETGTGKDLNWFFDDLMKTTKKIDYKVSRLEKNRGNDSLYVALKNVNDIASPVVVSLVKSDSIIYSTWVDGFKGSQTIALPNWKADKIQIDPDLLIPEINRRNNSYIFRKPAHKFQKLRFQFIGTIENQNRSQVFFTPYIGWNNYDKFQVGLAFYSPFLPKRKFEYMLVPAIGTASKQFIGFAKLKYNFFPDKVQQISLGLNGKRFDYMIFPFMLYNKLEPTLRFEFKKKNARSPYNQSLTLRSVLVWQQWINPLDSADYVNNTRTWQHYYVNELHYRFERQSTLRPFDVNVLLQQGNQFLGLWAEGHFKVDYRKKNQGLFIRVFAGGFPVYLKPSSDISAPLPQLYLANITSANYTPWLQKDYMFDDNYVDRNGQDKYLGRQTGSFGGGFYSITNFGGTNKFLAALNVNSTIYRYVPFRPYFSLGLVTNSLNKTQFAAELGLALVVLKDVIEIQLTPFATQNIRQGQDVIGITHWYQKITYTLKIPLVKPLDLLRQVVGL